MVLVEEKWSPKMRLTKSAEKQIEGLVMLEMGELMKWEMVKKLVTGVEEKEECA
jgi:hypothetical protein